MNGLLKLSKNYSNALEKIKELEYRAAVAERALELAMQEFFGEDEKPITKRANRFIEQAERELKGSVL
jgi:hypothetical protein